MQRSCEYLLNQYLKNCEEEGINSDVGKAGESPKKFLRSSAVIHKRMIYSPERPLTYVCVGR